ncbi:DUF262 domain-containing protein [Moraxella bovis]|uniref:Protein of uncharacterized function DUF262 n=1 Tax=Moraxella bovis TaxID=476 RepID=A0A378Q178_MORBO|nr:DUF262 domain-containing HNH endonuclease family protein [Moraxella bovis]STY94144.1 Protein of uncharacterised function DUF262 [Moraxella bovis]
MTVKKRADNAFEVIDGQQRLTTLFLILSVLGEDFNLNLAFEHRQNSSDELNIIKQQSELNGDSQIAKVYNYLIKNKDSLFIIKDGKANDYWQAIWKNVQIMQVELPSNADLNQYFERMNNRGEQLEQHEVIKAKLMSELKDGNGRAVFSAIWNACSDMSRHAVSSFSADERHELFQDKGEYFWLYENFDNLKKNFQKTKNSDDENKISKHNEESKKLSDILDEQFSLPKSLKSNKDNQYERFTSIIDFPNFLAQVLYLFLKDIKDGDIDKDDRVYRLDEKNLIQQFEKSGLFGDVAGIKAFSVHLLNVRVLFDRHVIKHDGYDNKNDWYVYQFKKSGKNNDYTNVFENTNEDRQIKLLQTMFHYSFPAKNYKYWLFAYLKWLNDESRKKLEKHEADGCVFKLPANEHIKFLEQLCDKFYFNRFYNDGKGDDYFDIIYQKVNERTSVSNCDFLHQGTAVENFIFNRLDYILWKKQAKWCWRNDENFKTGVDLSKFLKEFKFTSRNSVEHYYSQNPVNGKKLSDNDDENGKILNNFGNLCLINHSQNSSLSNRMPDEKKSGYKDNVARHQSVSIKQLLMFTYKAWDKNTIQEHGEKMIQLLNEKIST